MSTDLEQRLRGAMERFTSDVRVPPGLAARAYRHRQKRRMTARVTAVAGTAAVVAGSLAVAGAAGAFGSASGHPVQTTYTAYVVSRVEHALAASKVGNLLEYDRTVYAPGRTLQPVSYALIGRMSANSPWDVGSSVHWTYRGITKFSAFSPAGRRVFDFRLDFGHGNTAVIYRNGTWWEASVPGHAPNGPPPGCVRGGSIELSGGGGNGWPAFIRSQLACGAYTVAGHQAVDGVNAIKITGNSGRFTFWVDPVTYLPLQMIVFQQRTEFQWLTPTPAHLAQLKLAVPAGYRQVPAPPNPAP